jgi:hypothetical protein
MKRMRKYVYLLAVSMLLASCGSGRVSNPCEDAVYLDLAHRDHLTPTESKLFDSLNKRCWEAYNRQEEYHAANRESALNSSWIGITAMILTAAGVVLLVSLFN